MPPNGGFLITQCFELLRVRFSRFEMNSMTISSEVAPVTRLHTPNILSESHGGLTKSLRSDQSCASITPTTPPLSIMAHGEINLPLRWTSSFTTNDTNQR